MPDLSQMSPQDLISLISGGFNNLGQNASKVGTNGAGIGDFANSLAGLASYLFKQYSDQYAPIVGNTSNTVQNFQQTGEVPSYMTAAPLSMLKGQTSSNINQIGENFTGGARARLTGDQLSNAQEGAGQIGASASNKLFDLGANIFQNAPSFSDPITRALLGGATTRIQAKAANNSGGGGSKF